MADPYVRTPPVNAGACSATWYVDPLTEPRPGSDGSNPTFGQPLPDGIGGVTGAWQFLVPGLLKDVLTKEYVVSPTMEQEMLRDWAAAGGEVSFSALSEGAGPVYGVAVRPVNIVGGSQPTQQMAFSLQYDFALYPAVPTPIRWSVKFSVAHSLTQ